MTAREHSEGQAAPSTVYVLIRENGTIAGVSRDPFAPPRNAPGSRVITYQQAPPDA